MIPGMWGAPLKGLSGYLPPLTTQDFVLGANTAAAPATSSASELGQRKYSDFLHLPHGLEGFFDPEEAEAYAAKVGKPLFIDFTAHSNIAKHFHFERFWPKLGGYPDIVGNAWNYVHPDPEPFRHIYARLKSIAR